MYAKIISGCDTYSLEFNLNKFLKSMCENKCYEIINIYYFENCDCYCECKKLVVLYKKVQICCCEEEYNRISFIS
ncbi:hypothetical protein [Clostridium sp.]|uniref:hypothetical protein n=1 Tax=Clostridium sp. TaxID=1506 RepID=UPI002FC74748